MASHDYEFLTEWRVRGTCAEVYEVLSDAPSYVRWWPEVYLKIDKLASEDGARGRLLTRGFLSYTLTWEYHVVADHPPHGFSIEASGDFEGRGTWTFRQDGEWVDITFDWRIRAEKPLLKYLSFLLKPVFRWNHAWAMKKGFEHLPGEIERYRKMLK